MKHVKVEFPPETGFTALEKTARSQAAVMVLQAGDTSGGNDYHHPYSDQWLYVISGQGKAIVCGLHVDLRPGSLLLIEKGEDHEIRATGSQPFHALNFYAPPVF